MAVGLPSAKDLGIAQIRPNTGVAQYEGATGLEGAGPRMQIVAGEQLDQASQYFAKMQERFDITASEDRINQFNEKVLKLAHDQDGWKSVKGEAAFQQDYYQKYNTAFNDAKTELAGTLTSPRSKERFNHLAQSLILQQRAHMMEHSSSERLNWENKVDDGAIAIEQKNSASQWDRPEAIANSLRRVEAVVRNRGERLNLPKDFIDADYFKQAEKIHAAVIEQAIASRNLAYAELYFQQNKDQISLQTRQHLEKSAQPLQAKLDADGSLKTQVEAALTPVSGETLSSLKKAIRKTEGSGSEQESIQGAKGSMQITRETFDAYKKAGESYDKEADRVAAAERKIEADYQFYGGDVRKTAAAYIGGRGAIDEQGNIKNVQDKLGTTAKAYAEKVANLVGVSGGTPTRAVDTRAMLASWIDKAEQLAEQRHPGDLVYRDMVIAQVKSRVATITAAQEGMERQAHSYLLTAAQGLSTGGNKPTSMEQLLNTPEARTAWERVSNDGASARGIIAAVIQNANEAEGKPARVNAKLVQDLSVRMYLKPDDPNLISRPEQLTQYLAQGLTLHGKDQLVAELQKIKNPDGRDFQQDVHYARNHVRSSMGNSIQGRMLSEIDPGAIDYASLRWYQALTDKIDLYRKEGKETRSLIRADTPDSMVTPAVIQSFLPTAKDMTSGAAKQAKQTLPKVANDAEFNALPSGAQFVDPQGNVRTKPGTTPAKKPAEIVPSPELTGFP